MAGTLVITTLSDGTNSTSATNCIKGSVKAWVNFVGSSASITGSYNVSSVTRVSTGTYTVNYTNAFANTNYTAIANSSNSSSGNPHTITFTIGDSGNAPTTTYCKFRVLIQDASNYVDPYFSNFIAIGA
jgi:hypothetical protein